MMVRLVKDGREVEVKDFLANLYIRNGYELVVDKKEEPKEQPKKTTAKRTRKTQ